MRLSFWSTAAVLRLERYRTYLVKDELDEYTQYFRSKLLLRGDAECLAQEHPDQAIKWDWQVIRTREAYLPGDDPDVLDAKHQVASVYVRHDRHLEAIPILKRLIKVISSCLEPDDRLLLPAQHYLGLAHNYAGEYDKAIAVFGPLAVVHANVLDSKHKDRLITMNVLVCAHQCYGRSEKAIEIWEESASLESDLPANMEQVGDILRLATAYTDTGDTENATKVLEQWLSVRRKDGLAVKLLQERIDVEAQLLPLEDQDRQLIIHALACV